MKHTAIIPTSLNDKVVEKVYEENGFNFEFVNGVENLNVMGDWNSLIGKETEVTGIAKY